ncbi:transposable element Tc1 transposase [Trichonephila clavipes]|nr:transposable element Tc1 transposase [Trichonephila clavipes]
MIEENSPRQHMFGLTKFNRKKGRTVDLAGVRNCWDQCTREGTHARKTGSGASKKTTRREDRRILRQALVDLTVTRSTIGADVGVAIVSQTISRHLTEANLKSKRPFRALPLTPEHRQLRLQWCQARSMWNVTDWQNVVFSEDSWTFPKWSLTGNFLSKIMLVRIQQELLKTSYVIFRLFHGRAAPRFVPCRARVGSAKTADAIVSLCT